MFQRLLFAIAACFVAHGAEFALRDGETVLFLGDSNTYADHYIQYIDAYLFTRFPEKKFNVINRGMPSETAAGTSEPSHIPPRPDVHTRFSSVVKAVPPDVLIACYGMNDGVYLSPNEPTFAKYRAGIQRLIDRAAQETKARLILVTPPPFDARPFASRPVIEPADYRRPASDYDNALQQFSKWLLTLRTPDLTVIDIHTPIAAHLASRRQSNDAFQFAGDGIHLNQTGHLLWALELLEQLHAPAELAVWEADPARREHQLNVPLPMPHDEKWDAQSVHLARVDERLNRFPLKVGKSRKQPYMAVLSVPGSNLRATVNIPADVEEVDLYPAYLRLINGRAQDVMRLVKQRRQLLLEIWVRDDPHPRLAGMHKSSKANPSEVEELERKIRDLCKTVPVTLRFVPVAVGR